MASNLIILWKLLSILLLKIFKLLIIYSHSLIWKYFTMFIAFSSLRFFLVLCRCMQCYICVCMQMETRRWPWMWFFDLLFCFVCYFYTGFLTGPGSSPSNLPVSSVPGLGLSCFIIIGIRDPTQVFYWLNHLPSSWNCFTPFFL